jgi:hypothetical protein
MLAETEGMKCAVLTSSSYSANPLWNKTSIVSSAVKDSRITEVSLDVLEIGALLYPMHGPIQGPGVLETESHLAQKKIAFFIKCDYR